MRLVALFLTAGLASAGDPLSAPDHLALAAEHLDRGDAAKAISHLTVHISAHPDEAMTRAYLAELLFQSKRLAEAAAEFEAFVAQAQAMTGKPRDHLVHCHTRLMSIAEAGGDEHRERLHRGIGLWRLTQHWQGDRRDDARIEATLTQAMEQLRLAARDKPNDARTQLYLAEVAAGLGQVSVAQSHLRKAKALPPLGLTANERRRLAAFNDAQ